LKLKGTKDGGIKKKKKKSRDKSLAKANPEDPESGRSLSVAVEENNSDRDKSNERSREGSRERDGGDDSPDYYAGKTEAERRFEERKRKRVGSSVLHCGNCEN
jgi:protein FAM32A